MRSHQGGGLRKHTRRRHLHITYRSRKQKRSFGQPGAGLCSLACLAAPSTPLERSRNNRRAGKSSSFLQPRPTMMAAQLAIFEYKHFLRGVSTSTRTEPAINASGLVWLRLSHSRGRVIRKTSKKAHTRHYFQSWKRQLLPRCAFLDVCLIKVVTLAACLC